MFKGAFVPPKSAIAPKPNVISEPQYENPEIDKLRAMVLKWLTMIIGGGAVALVAWRIVLKFF